MTSRRYNIIRPPSQIEHLLAIDGIKEVPINMCGVYFLVCNREIVYIGRSCNVGKRIADHYADKYKQFDVVYYIEMNERQSFGFEKAMIRRFQPRLNKTDKRVFYGRRDFL